MKSRNAPHGLVWFGIGHGLVELLAPRTLTRATGLRGHERLLTVFAAREPRAPSFWPPGIRKRGS